jgi:hypothetical protein
MSEFVNWLFSTREGAFALMGICLVFFTLLAVLLERGTRRRYYDHEDENDEELARETEESIGKMIGRARKELEDMGTDGDEHDDKTLDAGEEHEKGTPHKRDAS